jgi:hypothetical protein
MLGSRPSLLSIIRVPNTKDRAANAVMGLRTGAIRAPESGTIDRPSRRADQGRDCGAAQIQRIAEKCSAQA